MFDLRISNEWRGHGIGKRVLSWLTHYVFTETAKHRLEAHTRADNIAMQKVLESAGWTKEAHYRQVWPTDDGSFVDAVTYAVLKQDIQP
ncbi:hypothetical protein GCM10011297_22170 [Bacterioplanes sanyensis]|uniref:GNAT family N-acetyltransferase n=1 Tax=Bacterioplanes sanyensis TaxID=1249553 RepID=UPI0016758742|nr:GNAT family protein [Bacterioplanes sanyensis]GGY48925.1 hypothetical protein GCM10011297_22170 [Bacterioplanes sanyensis]